MPTDKRLYMTFPNDIHRHPKITRLPVEVRWAFIEMNGEARIADNDGIFPAEDAEFTWGAEILTALVNSHPTRPLVVRSGDTYVIRDYAEHQQTKAEREALSAKRSAAGKEGARAKASAKQVLSNSQQTQAESESESKSEDYYSPLKSQSSSNRANDRTDPIEISETTRRIAGQQGLELTRIIQLADQKAGVQLDGNQALQLALHILGKAKSKVERPQLYVTGAITRSPAEAAQFIYEHTTATGPPTNAHTTTTRPPECEEHPGWPLPCDKCARIKAEEQEANRGA